MGTDMHLIVEVKYRDKWVGLCYSDYTPLKIAGRHYKLFAELAGVRGESTLGNKPKGLPEDASDLVNVVCYATWHSPSYTSMSEFISVVKYVDENSHPLDRLIQTEHPVYELFGGVDHYPIDNLRVVFWFDN